jgi:O-antigen ligase
VLIIASIVRDIVTLPILIESALDPRRNGLANFPIITAGGPNIEATILAIFAALMINRPIGKVLIILAILTSIAFQSRTGFACAAFILIVRTFINMNSFSLKKIAFIGSIIVIFSFSISSFVNLNFTVFDRIGNVRQELDAEGPMGHSVGRVMLWGTAAALVAEDPLGYGPGGAIRYAKDHLGARFIENNFHNIVIQFAADGGVLSAALYIILIVSILINCLKRRFANPIDLVVFIYIMTGFIQWTGYDPMGWIFIGMYSAMNRQMRLREGTDRQMYLQEGKEKR